LHENRWQFLHLSRNCIISGCAKLGEGLFNLDVFKSNKRLGAKSSKDFKPFHLKASFSALQDKG